MEPQFRAGVYDGLYLTGFWYLRFFAVTTGLAL